MEKAIVMMDEHELQCEHDYLVRQIEKCDDDAEIERLSERLDEVDDRLDEIANPNLDDY